MSDLKYSVIETSNNGEVVALNDGSKYFIWPGDTFKCTNWCPDQRIMISNTNEPTYEYALTNVDTSGPDMVKAHKI